MCLTVDKKFASEKEAKRFSKRPMRAESDMTVYKRLIPDGDKDKMYWSPYVGAGYVQNKKYKSKMAVTVHLDWDLDLKWMVQVNEGIHSYTSRMIAIINTRCWKYGEKVFACTIPKGAKYFIGENCEIVSNRLIIGEAITIMPDSE